MEKGILLVDDDNEFRIVLSYMHEKKLTVYIKHQME